MLPPKNALARKAVLTLLSCTLLAPAAQATLRCATRLIDIGDPLAKLIHVCGPPAKQASMGPVLKANGLPRKGSQKIDVMVYGPSGGAYRYLLFVNEVLTRVDWRRQPPANDLLQW